MHVESIQTRVTGRVGQGPGQNFKRIKPQELLQLHCQHSAALKHIPSQSNPKLCQFMSHSRTAKRLGSWQLFYLNMTKTASFDVSVTVVEGIGDSAPNVEPRDEQNRCNIVTSIIYSSESRLPPAQATASSWQLERLQMASPKPGQRFKSISNACRLKRIIPQPQARTPGKKDLRDSTQTH